jgi:hypothetical protein
MTIRHAAALALVGWYLLVPPISKTNDGYKADFNAPLGKWIVTGVYDQAYSCDQLQGRLVLDQEKKIEKLPLLSYKWALAQKLATSQCIATDDPRLAK